MPLFSQDYYYNGFGQIVYVAELGEAVLTTDQYLYDALGRLLWDRSNPAALQQFTYDNVGNRTVLNLPITSTGQTLAYKSLPATVGPNQLDKVTSYPVGPGVLNKFEQTYTYDLNGATLTRTTNTKNNFILTQVLETFGSTTLRAYQ